MQETTLLANKHCLVCVDAQEHSSFNIIKRLFCGKVIVDLKDLPDDASAVLYLCGDIARLRQNVHLGHRPYVVVRELSCNFEDSDPWVPMGAVPLNISGIGVHFPRFFDIDHDYFEQLQETHRFQCLRESDKTTPSHRTGLYLSDVEHTPDGDVAFHLLRCSTNLDGPTAAFNALDKYIIGKVNEAAARFFDEPAPLNHVLAQVYHNVIETEGKNKKERKAKIKAHSDKTKDMPSNGVIAFCTFYSNIRGQCSEEDPFDFVYKKSDSVLTRLRFRLKSAARGTCALPTEVVVPLYPHSVFIIPLSTNRLYTHEIVPPGVNVDNIPIRLGYVIRCSKTKALYKNGATHLADANGTYVKLEAASETDIEQLRRLYFRENTTVDVVDYGQVHFSLNDGDYLSPSKVGMHKV